jgi:hypothetical protein
VRRESVCVERRRLVPELPHACRAEAYGAFEFPRRIGACEVDDGRLRGKARIVEEHAAAHTDVW